MAIWLIRAGSHGEYEQKFIQENRVYVTWDNLDIDLGKLKQRADLTAAMTERYPDTKPKAITNWVGQRSDGAFDAVLPLTPLDTARAAGATVRAVRPPR